MNKAASVKARLVYAAEKEKRSYQEILQTYSLERVIFRLLKSKYADKFTLKGGIFLYALFGGKYFRATADVDFLGRAVSREKDALKAIFEEVFSVDLDDGIVIDPASIRVDDIAQAKSPPGVRITAMAFLERTRIPITIDIGFGDIIIPAPISLSFPALINGSNANVSAYSLESVVSEKLEAMAALGFLNSRYKDFFDICMLSRNYPFYGKHLIDAISETFAQRNTSRENIVALDQSFVADAIHQRRWKAFISKNVAMTTLSLADVVNEIIQFIMPVLNALREGSSFDKVWDFSSSTWR